MLGPLGESFCFLFYFIFRFCFSRLDNFLFFEYFKKKLEDGDVMM